MIALDQPAQICTPALVYDADTFTCSDGTKIRVAGVNSREIRGNPCPGKYPCPDMSAVKGRQVTVKLLDATVIGRRPTGHLVVRAPAVRYRVVGRNRDRVVAEVTLPSGRDLRCESLRLGSMARWAKYEVAYRLEPCRG